MPPYRLRRRLSEMRKPLVAPARGDHLEPRCACPVDEIADERGLIAVCQAVHDTGALRTLSEQRSAESIGFHGDHDDMLTVRHRGKGVLDRGNRVAGGFDDDVYVRMRNECSPVFREMRGAAPQRSVEGAGRVALFYPAATAQIRARVGKRKI